MKFIGIDIGTSSVCGAVYDSDSRVCDSLTCPNDAGLSSTRVWERIQDPERIMTIVREMLDQLMTSCGYVDAIGLAGQMHGVLYVDDRRRARSPLYTWQDGRGNRLRANGTSCVHALAERSGCPLSTGFGLVTHACNLDNGEVPPAAVKLCTIMDYAAMQLTGERVPVTDAANAASLGFFDVRRQLFDIEALRRVGIDPCVLPELCASGTCVGSYRSVPVYLPTGDNQAGFLGSADDVLRTVLVNVGTSSQISVYSDRWIEVEGMETRPFPGGGYLLVGASLCGGKSFELLRNFFGRTLTLFGGADNAPDGLYDLMERCAASVSTDDLPVVETMFGGSRTEPDRRGSIGNLSLDNFTPENLVVGFLRGMIHELNHFYQALPEALRNQKTDWVGVGNGLKRNDSLCREAERQFGRPLRLSAVKEAAAMGACMLAMEGRLGENRSDTQA